MPKARAFLQVLLVLAAGWNEVSAAAPARALEITKTGAAVERLQAGAIASDRAIPLPNPLTAAPVAGSRQ